MTVTRTGRFALPLFLLAGLSLAALTDPRDTPAAGDAASGGAGSGGAPDVEAALATITADDIRRHVGVLASDEFEGRSPGTAGEVKTLAYLEEQYRALGLEPAVNGSYRQEVPLVKKAVLPTPTIRVTGATAGSPVELAWGADMTIGTGRPVEELRIDDAELVFAGHGIVAPEYGWDDYRGLDVRGKIVLALGSDPGRTPEDSTIFKGRALTNHGLPATKQEEAARRGARGLVLIHDADVFGYPFDILTASVGRPRFEAVPGSGSPARTELTGTLRKERAAELFQAAGWNLDEATAAAFRPGFRPRALGLRLSVEARQSLEFSKSYNLLGLLRGAERPDEYVLYTAHWDHIGISAPVDGDSICNGAVDNATGTAALLEIAEAFGSRGAPPRSILFLATTAEEQGLLGSYHYADNPVVPLAQTVGAINMDALFPFGSMGGMTVTGYGNSELEQYMARAAARHGRKLFPDPSPEHGAFYRSDHFPLAKKGVPALFAVGGPDDRQAEDEAIMGLFNDYVTTKYHKPSDELTDAWDLAGIVQDVKIYFETGDAVARDGQWPNWYLDNEFRVRRDEMRAAAVREPGTGAGSGRTAAGRK